VKKGSKNSIIDVREHAGGNCKLIVQNMMYYIKVSDNMAKLYGGKNDLWDSSLPTSNNGWKLVESGQLKLDESIEVVVL